MGGKSVDAARYHIPTNVTNDAYDLGFSPSYRPDRPGRAKSQMQALAAGQLWGRTEHEWGKHARVGEWGHEREWMHRK